MIKFIKLILKTIFIFLFLIIGLLIAIFYFVNPNNYKDKISYLFQKNIGYNLQIDGKIEWSLDTKIGLYSQDLIISQESNKTSEQKLLTIKKLSIFINPIKSILNKKLIISQMELENLDLDVLRNSDKKMNTDKLINKISSIYNNSDTIVFDTIVFKNCIINLDDKLNEGSLNIKQLNLIIKQNNVFDLSSSVIELLDNQFTLEGEVHVDWQSKNLEIIRSTIQHNNLKYTANGKIKYANKKINGNTRLKLLLNNQNETDDDDKSIYLDTDFSINKQQLDFESVALTIGSGEISGNIKILNTDNTGKFDLKIRNISIPKIISALNLFTSQATTAVSTNNHNNSNLIKIFRKLQLSGHISGNNALIKPHLSINNINLNFESESPGIMKIKKGTFNIGQANVNVDLNVNVNEPKSLDFSIIAKNLDMPIISKLFFSGSGIINITGSTILGNYNDLLNHLNCNIDVVIANGQLLGFDFRNTLEKYQLYLADLLSYLKKDPNQDLKILLNSKPMVDNSPTTDTTSDFSVFKLQTVLKNGTDPKSKLILQHLKYSTEGYGEIDLIKNHLFFTLNTKLLLTPNDFNKEVPQYMQLVPLPININGSINKLVFSIDSNNYLLKALQELQKVILKSKDLIQPSLNPLESPAKSM